MKIPTYESESGITAPALTSAGADPATTFRTYQTLSNAMESTVKSLGVVVDANEAAKKLEREGAAHWWHSEYIKSVEKAKTNNLTEAGNDADKYNALQTESIDRLQKEMTKGMDKDTKDRFIVLSSGERARAHIDVQTHVREIRKRNTLQTMDDTNNTLLEQAKQASTVEEAMPFFARIEANTKIPYDAGYDTKPLQTRNKAISLWYQNRYEMDRKAAMMDPNGDAAAYFTDNVKNGYYNGTIIGGVFVSGVDAKTQADEHERVIDKATKIEARERTSAIQERHTTGSEYLAELRNGQLDWQETADVLSDPEMRDQYGSIVMTPEQEDTFWAAFRSFQAGEMEPGKNLRTAEAYKGWIREIQRHDSQIPNLQEKIDKAVADGSLTLGDSIGIIEYSRNWKDFYKDENWQTARAYLSDAVEIRNQFFPPNQAQQLYIAQAKAALFRAYQSGEKKSPMQIAEEIVSQYSPLIEGSKFGGGKPGQVIQNINQTNIFEKYDQYVQQVNKGATTWEGTNVPLPNPADWEATWKALGYSGVHKAGAKTK